MNMQGHNHQQLTLGFLTYYYKQGGILMMKGVFEAARKNNVNIIGFGCDVTTKAYHYDMLTLFEFIKKQNFNGLLFLGWLQVTGIDFPEFRNEFNNIPLYSIGSNYPDIPNIYMDGTSYYRELLIHLIEVHHCKRIAFFSPQIWDERILVYTETMQKYGIYDPLLLLHAEELESGDLNPAMRAEKGLALLLDERKTTFDAIALMYSFEYPVLLKELKKRGLKVPEDIKVIGYEDLDESKHCSPSLTTVYFPFYELGYYGCENFINMLRQKSTPFSSCVPGRNILRQSCGCLSNSVKLAIFPKQTSSSPASYKKSLMEIQGLIRQGIEHSFPSANMHTDKFLNKIFESIQKKNSTLFLNTLKEELNTTSFKDEDSFLFEDFISCLRHHLLPFFNNPDDTAWIETLFQEARILVTAKAIKNFGNENYQMSKSDFLLQETGQKLITAFNTEKIMNILESTLLKIHIPGCYIFLFNKQEENLDNCVTAFNYTDYSRTPCNLDEVISITNLPATTLPRHRCYSMLFHLLGIEYEKYGVVLFETGPLDFDIYLALTTQLSTALKSTFLLEKVTTTNRELQATQAELIAKAHQAGMAEIATDTLHNIGNVLNSVNTSVHLIQRLLNTVPIKDLERAENLLEANEKNIEDFICNDPRGKKLMQFFLLLEPPFDESYKQIFHNLNRLQEKINLIDEIIVAQQTYAGARSILEQTDLMAIIEDTLKMLSSSLERNKIEIIRNLHTVPKVNVQKNKLFHILVNLINNAQEAMSITPENSRRLTLSLKNDEQFVYILVSDTGQGIIPELLPALFTGEFTTQKGRLGFGLHCCADYMAEMGGNISASSSGPGTGATFILRFPQK